MGDVTCMDDDQLGSEARVRIPLLIAAPAFGGDGIPGILAG
jgi:hypothetical protein